MRFIVTGCSHRCMVLGLVGPQKSFLSLKNFDALAGWLQLFMLPSGDPWIGHVGQRGFPGIFHEPNIKLETFQHRFTSFTRT